MRALDEATATLQNQEIRAHRAAGGHVVGYACLFTPLEILDAAGIYPFRIRGGGVAATDVADSRMSRFNCSFCRACLQRGLDGTYDFLDGLVETNGCDQLRGMFEGWQYERPTPFFHYIKVPHLVSEESLDYFELELRRYVEALEAHFGVEVGDEALLGALERGDAIRDKLRRVVQAREGEAPKLTGEEALAVDLAGTALRPARFAELLDELLADLDRREGRRPRARLVLGGAATDELAFVRDIESLGAVVVADTLCFGSRAFWPRSAGVRGDPLRRIAEVYLGGSLCPRMYEELPARVEHLLGRVASASADGVVLVHNKFCDIHGVDNVMLRRRLEERGVPVLTLEKEYGAAADRGRMRTRVQAFLERIGGRS